MRQGQICAQRRFPHALTMSGSYQECCSFALHLPKFSPAYMPLDCKFCNCETCSPIYMPCVCSTVRRHYSWPKWKSGKWQLKPSAANSCQKLKSVDSWHVTTKNVGLSISTAFGVISFQSIPSSSCSSHFRFTIHWKSAAFIVPPEDS